MQTNNSIFKKIKLVLATLAVVSIGLFLGLHWYLQQSEAYRFTQSYLRNSFDLKRAVGDISSERLSWFHHSSIESTEINGVLEERAEFAMVVIGSKQSALVKLDLIQRGRGWKVSKIAVERDHD